MVDDGDAVTEAFHDLQDVGGEEDGGSLGDEVEENILHEARADGVHAFEGFIHEENLWAVDEGGGHGDTFPHSFGEFSDQLGPVAIHLQEGEEFPGPFAGEREGKAVDAAGELHIFVGREVVKKQGVLGDKAELALDGDGVVGQAEAEDFDFAGGGHGNAHQHTNGGGFTGAVGTEEAIEASPRYGEGEPIDGCLAGVLLAEIADGDGGGGVVTGRRCSRGVHLHSVRLSFHWPKSYTSMSTTVVSPNLREKALEGISKMPPFSPVLTKLLASLAKDDIMVSELANWIEKDTVLTGNVMRMVNSAAYGRMGTVSSVRHAITILGTNRLRNIVLGLSVCNMMSQLKLPAGWSTKQFNLHAVAVANMSDLLVQYMTVEYAEGAFVAGLLHDVGKLLLAVSCPEEYAAVISECRREGLELYDVEVTHFGFSHAELSQKVLESWKLPIPVQVAARYHHNPDADNTAPGLIALGRAVQLADFTVNSLGLTAVADDREVKDPSPVLQAVGLGEKYERILRSFEQEMEAIRGIL